MEPSITAEDEFTIPLERIVNLQEFRKSERMFCVICHNLLVSPLKCGDCLLHFCQSCIDSWTKKNNTCPNCRAPFRREKCERTLKEDLEDIKVFCVFKLLGCNDILKYENLFPHQGKCSFRPSQCPWCKIKGKLGYLDGHLKECDSREMECLGCLKTINHKEFIAHETPCLRKELNTLRQAKSQMEAQVKKKEKKLKFSQNLLYHHEGIQIIGKKMARMKVDEFQSSSVCLLKPKLKNHLVKWKIRIVKSSSWIGLGIGNGKVLASLNFRLSDAQIENMKHGSYMISNNGIAWSHDVKFENFIQNFTFQNDDVIVIEFNPDNKNLDFYKNGELRRQRMSQNFLSGISGEIYAIVVLGGMDDAVEILDSTFT